MFSRSLGRIDQPLPVLIFARCTRNHRARHKRTSRVSIDRAIGVAMTAYHIGVLVGMMVFGVIGYSIGNKKEYGALGFVLGLLLGLIGVIVIAVIPAKKTYPYGSPVMPPMMPPMTQPGLDVCPACRSSVGFADVVCPRCGMALGNRAAHVPEAGSQYSPIQPEAWWYQEEGAPPPPIAGMNAPAVPTKLSAMPDAPPPAPPSLSSWPGATPPPASPAAPGEPGTTSSSF